MKRAALVTGVSVTALTCVFTVHAVAAPAATQSSSSGFGFFRQRALVQPVRPFEKKPKVIDAKPAKAALHETDKTPPIPKGLLHVIVSIDKQRATLYADGHPVAQTKISSGTATHPTPMGVFSILQKNRHHVSNLYDAKMPYMQRITWSGAALHEGPLPGYPASHGCVRLPGEFAQLLWKATKIGARVIIARDEAAPVDIAHDRLFVAKARTEEPKVEPKPEIIKPEIRRELAPEAKAAPKQEPRQEPKPGPKLDIISERKAVPARSGETIETRGATAIVKTADATGTLRGPVQPDAAVKPLVPATARNTVAGEQPTKLPLHGDVDEIAMPPAPATTGAMAAMARPAPGVVTERPAPVVAERPAAVPVEPMAKQDRVAPPAVQPVAAAEAPVPAAPATAAEPPRRKGTVSVFVSLKENRVYVRQNMEPLFDAPVSVARPGEPIGTHVYTAMGAKADGNMRWTVVSIPSAYKSASEPKTESKTSDGSRKARNESTVKAAQERPAPVPSASAALDRIAMPQDTVERIASLITPGASLIVSDNKLSGETGATTDFIVETKKISDAADGLARHQPRRPAPRQYY